MSNTLYPAEDVFEGFWTDWTRGRTWGATLTLCPTSAIILTNSFAMFVTLCGIQLWTIVRYVLHHSGTTIKVEATTPHLKQQLILRNTNSALSTAQLLLKLVWDSRSSTSKPTWRAYSIVLTAVSYALLFTAAGIFSYKAISAPRREDGISAVLLHSNSCGVWNETYYNIVEYANWSTEDEFDLLFDYVAKNTQDVQLSLQYAQECYTPDATVSESPTSCQALRNATIGWTPTQTGTCPFKPDICHEESDTIILDTGIIDSHDHVGINAKPEDRLTYRRITTCAVLNGTSHVKGWNGSIAGSTAPSMDAAYAYYGPSTNQHTEWTYSYSNFASLYNNFSAKVTRPYQLDMEKANAHTEPAWDADTFVPIPELVQKDADLSLVFLSFTGTYVSEVEDPWFSAQQQQNFDVPASAYFLEERYSRGAAIGTVGCAEQHNFCTNDGICTGLVGFSQLWNSQAFNHALNPYQNATFDRMMRGLYASRLWWLVQYLSKTTTPLKASMLSLPGNGGGQVVSQGLPQNQWQIELEFWHTIAMAQFQRTTLQWATGQVGPTSQPFQTMMKHTEPQDEWYCSNFVVMSGSYQSFNVVAIVLVIVFGSLVVIVSLFIERLSTMMRQCFRKAETKKTWDLDNMLELRRINTRGRWRSTSSPANQRYSSATAAYMRSGHRASRAAAAHDRSLSSQLLPRTDPAFSIINGYTDSLPNGHQENGDAIQWPLRNSWMTISLNSMSPATPRTQANNSSEADLPHTVSSPQPVATVQQLCNQNDRQYTVDRGYNWV